MITPLFAKTTPNFGKSTQLRSPGLAGSRFEREAEQGAATASSSTGWQCDEKSLDVLPDIKYSARALRASPGLSPGLSPRPRLSPGESVGVYKHGKQGVTGGSLARVVHVDSASNSVKVELADGEEKDLPISSVFDPKLMNLVTGMRRTPRSPQKPKPVQLPDRTWQLPKMHKKPEPMVDISDDQELIEPEFFLPSPTMTSWEARQEANLNHQQMNAPRSNNFSQGISAETLSEIHLLLSRPEARAGPPCDAKSFKNALAKKFFRLEEAWEKMDTNGDGSLDFTEFTRACRNIKFAGNLKKIFKELTNGEDALSPKLLDAELPLKVERLRKEREREAAMKAEGGAEYAHGRHGSSAETRGEVHFLLLRPLAPAGPPSDAKSFKNALLKKFGALRYAWDVIDANADDNLQFCEFTRACRQIQFAGKLKMIYKELTRGQEVLKPELLDSCLPVELEKLRSQRSSPSSTPNTTPRGGKEKTPDVSSSGLQTLGEIQKSMERLKPGAGPPCDAKTFKKALLKKFQTLGLAWMKIDANGDGLLEYNEFVRACRQIQFSGNLKKIFQELTGGEESLRPELMDPRLPRELMRLGAKPRR